MSDDQWLDGKTHSLEVGNRPAAYILEVEEEEENALKSCIYFQGKKDTKCYDPTFGDAIVFPTKQVIRTAMLLLLTVGNQ
jgi:hypothetical protein